MPINSASIPALRVARNVKRRRRAEGGAIYDPMSGIRIGGESSDEPAPDPQGPLSRTLSRLTGTQFGEPRYQLWPEKMVRSGATLAGDVLSGSQDVLPPGLRREDYTDAPAPSEPTQDSTWLGRKLGIPPVQAQPNDPMMERAQDMAGMAGGQTLLAGAAERVPAAQRALVAAADSQATGAPLAAMEHIKTPQFKEWFGDSKVIDAQGKPLVAYHGTPERFSSFDAEKGLPYFTNKAEQADMFARSKAAVVGGRPQVIPTFLKIQNPLKPSEFALSYGNNINAAKAAGFDGVIDRMSSGEVRYQPFDPEQIKSAGKNSGNFDPKNPNIFMEDAAAPGAPLAAVEHAPKFYSGLERAVEAIPQPTMTGQQWLGTLNNRGVKAEEMQWSGLGEYLGAKADQPVTKAEVAQHLGFNRLELGEVHRGEMKFDKSSPYALPEVVKAARQAGDHPGDLELVLANDGDAYRALTKKFPDLIENEDWANIVSNSVFGGDTMPSGTTKYHDYQLPGAENYREKLLTLPPTKNTIEQWKVYRTDGHVDSTWANAEAAQRRAQEVGGYSTQGDADKITLDGGYRSSHWDEPNVLVHRRTNERDVNGKRALHIEEIQSDWHQQGRKQGYIDPNNRDPGRPHGQVPDAPFKKNWHDLALKDAIREAAEKGIDRISWTPGEAQAARYDLSKHISNIRYSRPSIDSEGGSLVAMGHGDAGAVVNKYVAVKDLPDVIGKEAAEKLLKAKPRPLAGERGGHISHQIGGLDLKVGGEGMRGFYDKIIPDALNKIGKPHGVKVEMNAKPAAPQVEQLQNGRGEKLLGIKDSDAGPFKNMDELNKWWGENTHPVHYMDIPSSLKEQALKKGFSLFEDSSAAGAPLAASQNFSDADIAALAAAAQESGKRQKKPAMPPPERMAGGMVANPAMDVARNIKRAKGGKVHLGPIIGDTDGRADKVPMEVPDGSYILTSDHVSSMGEGNTLAGFRKLKKMFPKSAPAYKEAKAHGPQRATGGRVPILAADGEFAICPLDILDRYGDLDHGHRILDHWQTTERKNHIKTLSKLAPPAQD